MENCIFCKIINKDIPSYKIYEDDKVYAFLDISDDIYGHTLVIPKKHSINIFDTDDEYLAAVIKAVKKISLHYKSKGFDGVNIFSSNDEAAEQGVMHLHFHIFPRKQGDGKTLYPKLLNCGNDLKEVQEFLKLN